MKKTKALLKMEEQAQETLLNNKNLGICVFTFEHSCIGA